MKDLSWNKHNFFDFFIKNQLVLTFLLISVFESYVVFSTIYVIFSTV